MPGKIVMFASPRAAFTLLEVLLALALAALVAAAAAPLLAGALGRTIADEAVAAVEETAMALYAEAVASGNGRVARLAATGLQPGPRLPAGWKLEVRRFGESRFRRPREGETWEFNNAGICEPLAVRLSHGTETVELQFDPLTGQTLDD